MSDYNTKYDTKLQDTSHTSGGVQQELFADLVGPGVNQWVNIDDGVYVQTSDQISGTSENDIEDTVAENVLVRVGFFAEGIADILSDLNLTADDPIYEHLFQALLDKCTTGYKEDIVPAKLNAGYSILS